MCGPGVIVYDIRLGGTGDESSVSLQNSSKSSPQGVGASLRRNEDARFLDGKGEYLADLQVPGMAEVFFLRSPVAHGKIRSITVPEAALGPQIGYLLPAQEAAVTNAVHAAFDLD